MNMTFALGAVDGGRYVISLFPLADGTGYLIAGALHCVEAKASEQRLVYINRVHLLLVCVDPKVILLASLGSHWLLT